MEDFLKQIEAEADHRSTARGRRDCGGRVCSRVKEDFVALAVEQKAISINRHSLTAKRNEIVSAKQTLSLFLGTARMLAAASRKAIATWRHFPEPCCLSRVEHRTGVPGRQNSQGVLNNSKNSTIVECSTPLAITPIISELKSDDRTRLVDSPEALLDLLTFTLSSMVLIRTDVL